MSEALRLICLTLRHKLQKALKMVVSLAEVVHGCGKRNSAVDSWGPLIGLETDSIELMDQRACEYLLTSLVNALKVHGKQCCIGVP